MERVATPGAASDVPYWLWMDAGAARPTCNSVTPPVDAPEDGGRAPDGCGLDSGPPYAGVADPGIDAVQALWFYAKERQIVGIGVEGDVRVDVRNPAYRDWFTGGTGRGVSFGPLFTHSSENPIPIAFVAPLTGWYLVTVWNQAAAAVPFQIRYFASHYEACEMPAMFEATGGPSVEPFPGGTGIPPG